MCKALPTQVLEGQLRLRNVNRIRKGRKRLSGIGVALHLLGF
jgi:hypothetical protein